MYQLILIEKDPPLNDSNWEETSYPEAKENGHRTFENTKTGETIRHDAGKPGIVIYEFIKI